MAKTTVKVEGLKDLRRELQQLPRRTQGAVLRRTAAKALAPMRDKAASMAPVATGITTESIDTSPKLTARQRKASGRVARRQVDGSFRSPRATGVEIHMGPAAPAGGTAPDPAALQQEFGNIHHPPQPFMRPSWDTEKYRALETVKAELAAEIARAAQRAARALARGGTRRRKK